MAPDAKKILIWRNKSDVKRKSNDIKKGRMTTAMASSPSSLNEHTENMKISETNWGNEIVSFGGSHTHSAIIIVL